MGNTLLQWHRNQRVAPTTARKGKTMTNNEIIFWASVELMNQGKIGTTGKVIIYKDGEGNEQQMQEPEAIHTFQAWKQLGYSVKKGQKSVAAIQIWKCSEKKAELTAKSAETGEDVTVSANEKKMFRKTAFFFSASQVERSKTA